MSVSAFSSSPWIPLSKHTPKREDFYSLKSQLSSGSIDRDEYERRAEEKLRSVPLTRRDGRSLRDDVQMPFNGSWVPCQVGGAVKQLTDYVDDKRGLSVVLEDMNSDGNQIRISQSHRFEESYMTDQMGKFYAVEREAVRRWGSDGLTMVMLTLSASPFDESGEIVPPVDHLDSIMDANYGSWRAVRTGLGRVMGDLDWEYARILEPHTPKGDYVSSGYCHVHVGLFVNDPNNALSKEDFQPVINSHLNNCKTAGPDAHRIVDDSRKSAVSLTRYDPDREGGMGAYLTAYLGEQLEETVEDAPDYLLRYMAVLWASGRRRVSFSNGAQEWIRADYASRKSEEQKEREQMRDLFAWLVDDEDWQMVGVEKPNDDGGVDFIECSSSGGGSYMSPVRLPKPMGQSRIADTDDPYDEMTLDLFPHLRPD